MLQRFMSRTGLFRRKSASAAKIASRLEAADDEFCAIVSDLALISRGREMRVLMPIVQVAADGKLQKFSRRRTVA